MSSLQDLIVCCQQLNADKVSERKRQMERLRHLLSHLQLVRVLDKNSDSSSHASKSTCTWDNILTSVQTMIEREANLMENAKLRGSKTNSASAAAKKRKECMSLLKFVIQTANKRGTRLSCTEIMTHIMAVLTNEYTNKIFGSDYSKILAKEVLPNRNYITEISVKTWDKLLEIYIEKIVDTENDAPVGTDRVLFSSILCMVVQRAVVQISIKPKMITGITAALKNLRLEKNHVVVENLLAAVNCLCKALAFECRNMICKLGETVFTSVLYFFTIQVSESLRHEVVEFMQLQMSVHHPLGVKQVDDGALAIDIEVWNCHLRHLYEALYNEMFTKSSRGSASGSLSPGVVDLASSVFHQVLTETCSAIDVTQLSGCQTLMSTSSSKKRRRIETGWDMLRNQINSLKKSKQVIPWLQLLHGILVTYSSDLPCSELLPFLTTIHVTLSENKIPELSDWLFLCLSALGKCEAHFPAGLLDKDVCKSHWAAIWATTVRYVAAFHNREGMNLLSRIIQLRLFHPDKKLFHMFLSMVCPVTWEALNVLSVYLDCFSLPEKFEPDSLSVGDDQPYDGRYILRFKLLKWLLRYEVITYLHDSDTKSLLTSVLFRLCLKYPSESITTIVKKNGRGKWSKQVEENYLRIAFHNNKTVINQTFSNTGVPNSLLVDLQNELHSTLVESGKILMQKCLYDDPLKSLCKLVCFCGLVTRILQMQVCHGVFCADNLPNFVLVKLVLKMLESIVHFLKVCEPLETDKTLVADAVSVIPEFWFDVQEQRMNAQLSRSCMSADLLEWLLQQATRFVEETQRCDVLEETEMDDFDKILDFPSNITKVPNDSLFDINHDDNDTLASQCSEMSLSSQQSAFNMDCDPLSDETVTKMQKLQLACMSVLCKYCINEDSIDDVQLSGSSSGVVKTKLLAMLDKYDKGRAAHLHMLITIVSGLTTENHKLNDRELGILLEKLQTALKEYYRNQTVVSRLLDILNDCIPRVFCPTSSIFEKCQESVLFLIGVFWNMWKASPYLPPTNTKLAVAKCIMTVINSSNNAWELHLKHKEDRGVSVLCEYPFFFQCREHLVQILVIESLPKLFGVDMYTGEYNMNKEQQLKLFYDICNRLKESLNSVERLKGNEKKDQTTNKQYVILKTLRNIAISSPALEKRVVLMLCMIFAEYDITLDMTRKVLQDIAVELHYPDVQAYMLSHLPYLLHDFLSKNIAISSFPCKLFLHNSTKSFFKEYYKSIVPYLVMHDFLKEVKELAADISMEYKLVLQECFPTVVAHILPFFVMTSDPHTSMKYEELDIQDAILCYNKYEKDLGDDAVQDHLLTTNVAEVVFQLLMLLDFSKSDRIRAEFTTKLDFLAPELNPPCFEGSVIAAALDYLTTCGKKDGNSTLVMLLAKKVDDIQKIICKLASAIARSHTKFERFRILLMYKLFVTMLMQELPSGLGGSWSFVLKSTIYTLCHVISQLNLSKLSMLDCNIGLVSFQLLEVICTSALKFCKQEVERHLPYITSTIVPLIMQNESHLVSEKAFALLELLVVDNGALLSHAIKILDPFPCTEAFERLHEAHKKFKYENRLLSLEEEIELFVNSELNSKRNSRMESLKFLCHQLGTRMPELIFLAETYTKQQPDNVLPKLICELINICKCSSELGIRREAAKCLGHIGVPDMLAMLLLPNENTKTILKAIKIEGIEAEWDFSFSRKYLLLHVLANYLTDPDITVVTAACSVVKQILATKLGQDFMLQYAQTQDSHLLQLLTPFKSTKKADKKKHVQNEATFLSFVNSEALWMPEFSTHSKWITNLVCALINSSAVADEVLLALEPVCKTKVEFCEMVVPYLVHDILSSNSDTFREVISQQFRNFFAAHCGCTSQRSRSVTPSVLGVTEAAPVYMCTESLRVMLNVVQHLRCQQQNCNRQGLSTPWDNNFWIEVDYLHLAKAAHYCSSDFSSVLFMEIWYGVQRNPLQHQKSGSESEDGAKFGDSFFVSQLDSIGSSNNDIDSHGLLLEAYKTIGDPDSVYGCVVDRLTDATTRINMYEFERKSEWALGSYYNLPSKAGITCQNSIGIYKAMQNMGLYQILNEHLCKIKTSCSAEDDEIKELQFECAWRNCQWDLDSRHASQNTGMHEAIYSSLQAIKDNDASFADEFISSGREAAMSTLCHISLESVRNVCPVLCNLQCLLEIEEIVSVISGDFPIQKVIDQWLKRNSMNCKDYDFVEPIISLRCLLLSQVINTSVISDREVKSSVQRALIDNLIFKTRIAREAGLTQVAENTMHLLKELHNAYSLTSMSWRLEEALIYWARSDHDTALCFLKSLVEDLLEQYEGNMLGEGSASLYPQSLCVYAEWLSTTRYKHPRVIMENYLEKAVVVVENLALEGTIVVDAYLALARYADQQYSERVKYIKSSTFESKRALIEKSKNDAKLIIQYKQQGDGNQNITVPQRALRTIEKQSEIDKIEIDELLNSKNELLVKAVHNYLKVLRAGDEHDLRIFRLISLWFDNIKNPVVNNVMNDDLQEIKSSKFLVLMYQLAARMTVKKSDGDIFQSTLEGLIRRTVIDHPHHTLSIILALANSNKDNLLAQESASSSRGRRKSKEVTNVRINEEERVLAAKNLLFSLKSHCGQLISDMELLSNTFIAFAYLDVRKYKNEQNKALGIPKEYSLLATQRFRNVSVPIVEIPVDDSCQYKNVVTIHGFKHTFSLAGGINLPKILTCIGTDGKHRRLLVKGNDDLRQDAVMEQVFGIVNMLLRCRDETRNRQLSIRQYKVVPLSQRSGLLEWCEGTTPFGMYLIGSDNESGAHKRYHPSGWTGKECRKAMYELPGTKYERFLTICKNFPPVFRHFFFEKFLDPAIWFERRITYTRSVATNSIIGYVLGLGDRHVQNILIDCNTAEMIHIDLGVAFEQGKILPTPETVPFRLTRDVIDGMGITGTEGVFRRCCEKTMQVLHNSQEAIMTIVEVLLYDPLYVWNLSPLKAFAIQHDRDESAIDVFDNGGHGDVDNSSDGKKMAAAERVLLRLQQKLQGVEDSVPLSVSGQVSHLIQEARDPKNLSVLFPGWAPYI